MIIQLKILLFITINFRLALTFQDKFSSKTDYFTFACKYKMATKLLYNYAFELAKVVSFNGITFKFTLNQLPRSGTSFGSLRV
jgi:hypothetical protein